ncbi:hypothetical protein BU23DRAFT_505075 [Bimuria novae-zelandiae CBS 107.79]|uniref:RING-type domain-containing protein n=1 Tax=Bimuria novae-zelandiae CBS 107.79 TaxID=1447943 RepID=A0A6A5VB09_9PLEO|nr:hypothetical protein BU23DRAFT_505075 [Bimuria novae-zelandiae CBS 107.79]
MSSTAVHPPPPPILFGQPPSSSPSFSSPQSPVESQHHTQPQMASSPPPPLTAEDVDMSASTTLPAAGQRHDREDAVMQDGLIDGVQPEATNTTNHNQANNVAIEVAAVAADEDAMDTTSDDAQGIVLPNGSADPPAPAVTPASPNDANQAEGNNENAINVTANIPNDAPPEPPVPADLQPPPPPPPVENAPTDTDSSDDDGGQPWHPIAEDTSAPDDDELREIEAGTERSGLDHEYWEKKAFVPLEDPEYTPAESGRITWLIDNYNGTREKPNRDLVMKSEPVTIGGHQWRIKFYPKGNDSDYLSVYVECLSVEGKRKKEDAAEASDAKNEDVAESKVEDGPSSEPVEFQHTPLPLLGSKSIPKRKSVAAQVSVVLYNPSEPRVNYSRTCLHRFCTSSPDWGWTRFCGPHYDISHRIRGHRQALLRDDKLAFTGYIRIVEDETNCLWEHPSGDNVWDSFAMTGLQSVALRDNGGSPDGNVVSAVTSWLLFKPFRQFLYRFEVLDSEKEPFSRPKPLIGAFQKVLYQLRTEVQPGAGPVDLGDIFEALDWYGPPEPLHKFDVVQVWEYIRTKLEDELLETPHVDILDNLYGPKRDYTKGVPSYRVPVVSVGSMQEAVNQSPDFLKPGTTLPQLLTIELERQVFDPASHSYVKVLNKVTLDDHINVRGIAYTLYGFVVHKQNLQSCIYQPILRPEGPDSKWYNYTDSREGNKVVGLTHRQAVTAHEGKEAKTRVTGNDSVAYIAMYVRDDVAQPAFTSRPESEQWEVPEWITRELERQKASEQPPPIPIPTEDPGAPQEKDENKTNEKTDEEIGDVEERQFHIVDSAVFLQHEGPGYFDAFDERWQSNMSGLTASIALKATDGCQDIREKIAAAFKDVKDIRDPRQVKFWFVDTYQGSFASPHLLSTGKIEYSSGSYNRYATDLKDWKLQNSSGDWGCRRLWVHVIPFADLPEPPKDPEPEAGPEVASGTSSEQIQHAESAPAVDVPVHDDIAAPVPEVTQPLAAEDTPMSEPDEPELEPQHASSPPADAEPPSPPTNAPEGDDTNMVEVDASMPPDPPVVDVVIPNNTGDDTEMGGTQDSASLPPPPTDLPVPPPGDAQERPRTPPPAEAPRPRTPEPPPDEIYFFLKYFNAEKQILEPKGSFIVLKSARLDSTVQKLLELPDTKFDWWEEEDLVHAHALRRNKSFASNDLHNAAVIIYAPPLTDEQKNALADRAAFADFQQFLQFRANARNFPARMNGHFTFNYFSSQYYKGVYVNGHRHGHGLRIYHSGATYSGSFRLGQRHGHGLYTFQNGDTYDGEWVANQQHGTGTFVEATTGNTYTGGWRNDKKFGEGVTHWKSAQETERLCRICWEEPAEAAFYDCGHVVACVGCARQVESCPVCRRRVLSAMKLYYVV